MISISGHTITEQIGESKNSLVFRGIRLSDKLPLVYKIHRKDYPLPCEIKRYEREYEITRSFDCNGIIRTYGLQRLFNSRVMFLEDFGGSSLKDIINQRQLKLHEVLNIAVVIANILGNIHESNVIHKDINPTNIVARFPEKPRGDIIIKIIDFGISSVVSREYPQVKNPDILEGTLSYMSPEQTGRINLSMDYRTDFYSYGVMLYELLSGDVPFSSRDIMETVHAHIAVAPAALSGYQPKTGISVPEVLSKIVLKLLAKDPAQRYQSIQGIVSDLYRCYEDVSSFSGSNDMDEHREFLNFEIGKGDTVERFCIPEVLYGRQKEISKLEQSLENIFSGSRESVFCYGEPGIGKSALIRELYKPTIARQGYFVSGKYDQFKRMTPYKAIIQALRSLVKNILSESEKNLRTWKEKMLVALGNNGQLIIEVIPETELIIGKQPEIMQLPPKENQNRFHMVLKNFVLLFAAREHPLVLFLDDLQWADHPSLQFLEVLVKDNDLKSFLLVCTYREQEAGKNRILTQFVNNFGKQYINRVDIRLSSLDTNDIEQMLNDIFSGTGDDVKQLAEQVKIKTNGNPFFITEFLKSLYYKKYITFKNKWIYDLDKIEKTEITDNVVDFLTEKIRTIPERAWDLLEVAAAIGSEFELELLLAIVDMQEINLLQELQQAFNQGLLIKKDQRISFVHDRVYETVNFLAKKQDQQKLHYKIGKIMLRLYREEEDKVFNIAEQWNRAVDHLNETETKLLKSLNIKAGKLAKESIAYEASAKYYNAAVMLLSEDAWEAAYKETLDLYVALAESEYLAGNHKTADTLFDLVMTRAKDAIEKAKIYEIKIYIHMLAGEHARAVHFGLRALKELGYRVPGNPGKITILINLFITKIKLRKVSPSRVFDLPEITDQRVKVIIRIIHSILSPVAIAGSNYFPVLLMRLVRLVVKFGYSPYLIPSFIGYSVFLSVVLKDFDGAYSLGKLALEKIKEYSLNEFLCYGMYVNGAYTNHLKKSFATSRELFLSGYPVGIDFGDFNFASYCINHSIAYSLYLGKNVYEIKRDIDYFENIIRNIAEVDAIEYFIYSKHIIENLTGNYTKNLYDVLSNDFNGDEILQGWTEKDIHSSIFFANFHKSFLHFLDGTYAEGCKKIETCKKYYYSVTGRPEGVLLNYYSTINYAGLSDISLKKDHKKFIKIIKRDIKQIKPYADSCPANYRVPYLHMQAEYFRLTGNIIKAQDFYNEALIYAKKYDLFNYEALVSECCAKFYLFLGQKSIASNIMNNALYAYKLWGVEVKVTRLKEEYIQYFGSIDANKQYDNYFLQGNLPTSVFGREKFDVSSIMSASHAISGEIDLDKLMVKLLRIIIQNAGAEKGYLLLIRNFELSIEARYDINKEEQELLISVPLAKAGKERLCREIIQFVSRTKEDVVLENASVKGGYENVSYIEENNVRSVLCTPLISSRELIGLIYLENNISSGVFTSERIEIARLLATQATISIINARAIATQAEQVKLQIKNEMLDKLNRDKDRFFSIVAHDLKGPFMPLLSLSQYMHENIDRLDPADLNEISEDIYNSAKNVYSLLENLLFWSQMQQGYFDHVSQCIYLNEMIDATVRLFIPGAMNKEISLDADISGDLYVMADKNMLNTVLRNLINNAIKFTGPKGQVRITASSREQGQGDAYIVITVSDNGIGINKNIIHKLFTIDQQVVKPGTGDEKGSGLGLIICKEMVEMNNGTISIKSIEGEGTFVTVTLPAADKNNS